MRYVTRVGVVGALLLTACGSDDEGDAVTEPSVVPSSSTRTDGGDGAEPTDEVTSIKVLYSPNSEQLALFVAEDAGIFDAKGLEVTLEEGTQIEVAVVGGSADMGLTTAPDVLQASQEDVELVFAAGGSVNTPDNPRVFLMAGKDSGITEPADLEGARVAVPGRGSFAELAIAIILERDGVDANSINWVELPFPQMSDALDRDVVDAVVTVVPFTTFMEGAGHIPLVNAADLADRVPIAVLTATRTWAQDHAAALRDFRAALDEAAQRIEADPEFAKEVEEKYTGLPPEIVSQIPFSTFTSVVAPEEVQVWIDILEQQGLLEVGADADTLVVPPIEP